MTFDTCLADFLSENRIGTETWRKANVSWDLLTAIAQEHLSRQVELRQTAEMCARILQGLPKVHSVRWRVKDVDHLVEKIIRKRAEGGANNKYLEIEVRNYHEIVTDLVGLRALHLFKDDCFDIDAALRESFRLLPNEDPIAYVREGDAKDLQERFTKAGLIVEPHRAGYRSVHYVVATRPLQRETAAEVQVRTIFEEGWSEIDHQIRYPNLSDDHQVAFFLSILNGHAGSADEMGTFLLRLVASIDLNQQQLTEANAKYEEVSIKLDATVAELAEAAASNAESEGLVKQLKLELDQLRAVTNKPRSGMTPEQRRQFLRFGFSYSGLPILAAKA